MKRVSMTLYWAIHVAMRCTPRADIAYVTADGPVRVDANGKNPYLMRRGANRVLVDSTMPHGGLIQSAMRCCYTMLASGFFTSHK